MKCSFLSSLLITAGALLAGSRPAHALQEVAVPCAPTGITTPISYGEHAKCAISNVGEVDVYQFFGTAGDVVRIGIAGTSTTWGPQLELFQPSNPLTPLKIAGCNPTFFATCSTYLEETLPETGVYAIRVFDFQNNHGGNYALNLERLPRDGQVPTIDYGTSVVTTLEHASDIDWFAFDAFTGTLVQLTGSSTPGCGVRVEIIDSAGVIRAFQECQSGCATAPIVFNPPADGRYYISVQDPGYNNVGTITVALSCVVGNCPTTTPIPSIGSSYCTPSQNSTGSEARISALGSRFVADNDVYLVVTGVPTQRQGLFFLGLGQQDVAFLNGCGRLCVTPPVVRRPVQFTSSSNTLQLRLDLTHPTVAPLVSPGSPTYFQAWFRDPTGTSSCSGPTNTTDGLRINFL